MRNTPAAPFAPSDRECPACHSTRLRRAPGAARRAGVDPPDAVLLCRRCGLGWRWPAPRVEYEAGYFEQHTTLPAGATTLPDHLHERLDTMSGLVGRPGRLLDVGCGFGTFLAAARERGWEVQGVDVSRWTARHIAKAHGIEIRVGDFTSVGWPATRFDIVHMNHTLEHLEDPAGALRHAATLLARPGWLFVEVPNEFHVLYDHVRRAFLNRVPVPADPNPHLFFFTPRSLGLVSRNSGYAVRSLATPRWNRDTDSRMPLGTLAKRCVWALERRLRRGPNITMIATPADA